MGKQHAPVEQPAGRCGMSRNGELGTEDLAQPGGVRQQERPASGAEGGEGAPREGDQQNAGFAGERGERHVGFEGNTATDDMSTDDMSTDDMATQKMDTRDMPTRDLGTRDTGTRDTGTRDTGTRAAAAQRPDAAEAYQGDETSGAGMQGSGMSGAGASATTGDQGAAASDGAGGGSTGDAQISLLDRSDQDRFRQRWSDAQARFVDDPRGAVQAADGLVAELMQSMAQGFSEHKGRLEAQWQTGGDPDTEELRQALQRYRSFFDRLLST